MPSALVTGGAHGIGAGLVHALSKQGYDVTIVDKDRQGINHMVDMIQRTSRRALGKPCDVRNAQAQREAFASHVSCFGSLDVVCLNAGMGESGDFIWDDNWKECLDVNLVGVLYGVRLAVQYMKKAGCVHKGTILVVASAGGLWPMPVSPVYSAAKAACVMLTRSLGPVLYKKHGVRLQALCPEFVDTDLVKKHIPSDVATKLLDNVGGRLLHVDQVTDVMMWMIGRPDAAGECVALLSDGRVVKVHRKITMSDVDTGQLEGEVVTRYDTNTKQYGRKIVVVKLSNDFREATRIVDFPVPVSVKPGWVLVKHIYAGVNASDVNFTAGRYSFSNNQSRAPKLPMDCGFEACGVVALSSHPDISVGQSVAFLQYGGFSEYSEVQGDKCFAIPQPSPEAVAMLTCGMTASIALEHAARVLRTDTVLITAAAGGTGQFFVQLCKLAGATVIATCGSPDKATLLKSLGADIVINYKEEDVGKALRDTCPQGVSLVLELVGGSMFDVCLKALAPGGRLIIIGAMSQYSSGWKPSILTGVPERLLAKNQSIVGFFLMNYASHFRRHHSKLMHLYRQGLLRVAIDKRTYRGIDQVFDAVDRLQSGQSSGKVVVHVQDAGPPRRSQEPTQPMPKL